MNQLVNVRMLVGMRRDPLTGALLREFAEEGSDGDVVVPAQLIFLHNPCPDPRFIEQAPKPPSVRTCLHRFVFACSWL